MQNFDEPFWWTRRIDQLLELSLKYGNALVYCKDAIIDKAENLQSQSAFSNILYAMKANFNPEILKIIASTGVGFECVSPGEINHLISIIPGLDKERILGISKCDMLDEELTNEIKKTLPKEIEHIFFSSIAEKGLSKLKDKIWSQLNF